MDKEYTKTLDFMEEALNILANEVPKPKRIPYCNSFTFRYVEKTPCQAIILKLARVITGLHSASILMENGFFQEQGALQRMLDELNEDIVFLVSGLQGYPLSHLHKKFLDSFFEEEFDIPESPVDSTQKRAMIPRKKIQAYIAKVDGIDQDWNRTIKVNRTIHKAYSGFVHASSTHIMDLYGGNPPRFHVAGMLGTIREKEHQKDIWNYFYRSTLSFGFTALAFKQNDLYLRVVENRDRLIEYQSREK